MWVLLIPYILGFIITLLVSLLVEKTPPKSWDEEILFSWIITALFWYIAVFIVLFYYSPVFLKWSLQKLYDWLEPEQTNTEP